jgi:hypothetical protein
MNSQKACFLVAAVLLATGGAAVASACASGATSANALPARTSEPPPSAAAPLNVVNAVPALQESRPRVRAKVATRDEVCRLLTQEEATGIFGAKAIPAPAFPMSHFCGFISSASPADTGISIYIFPGPGHLDADGTWDADGYIEMYRKSNQVETLTGFGEKSIYIPDGNGLLILKKGRVAQVMIRPSLLKSPRAGAELKRLAPAIAARL